MPPKFFERFRRENLDDDAIFDRALERAVAPIFDRDGVNAVGIHNAYEAAKALNAKRKTPQHKNYLLNIIHREALSAERFTTDMALDPNLTENVDREINRLKKEP